MKKWTLAFLVKSPLTRRRLLDSLTMEECATLLALLERVISAAEAEPRGK